MCVFRRADLRFELFPSAADAELVGATLRGLPTCLTLFNNGNGKKGACGLTIAKYDAQGKARPGFKGFWWDIDATEAARWRCIRATAVFRCGQGESARTSEVMTNSVRGVTDGAAKLTTRVLRGGSDGGYSKEEGHTFYLGEGSQAVEVLWTVHTEFGILKGPFHWQVSGKDVSTAGPDLRLAMERGKNYHVTAWGEAPNVLSGNVRGGPGPSERK